jgi:hypothetical protein
MKPLNFLVFCQPGKLSFRISPAVSFNKFHCFIKVGMAIEVIKEFLVTNGVNAFRCLKGKGFLPL